MTSTDESHPLVVTSRSNSTRFAFHREGEIWTAKGHIRVNFPIDINPLIYNCHNISDLHYKHGTQHRDRETLPTSKGNSSWAWKFHQHTVHILHEACSEILTWHHYNHMLKPKDKNQINITPIRQRRDSFWADHIWDAALSLTGIGGLIHVIGSNWLNDHHGSKVASLADTKRELIAITQIEQEEVSHLKLLSLRTSALEHAEYIHFTTAGAEDGVV